MASDEQRRKRLKKGIIIFGISCFISGFFVAVMLNYGVSKLVSAGLG